MSKRVALIVDNPYRDLPGLVLVATRLCQQGVTCYLVPFNLQNHEISFLTPDFVLLNYLRKTNESFAWYLTKLGIGFGILDTEGAVYQSLDAFAWTMATNPYVRKQASVFCSWGPRFAEHASSAGWYGADQMIVTGSPRFDYYAAPWRQAALRVTADTGRYGSGLVLVNGSFPIANPQFQSPEAEVEMYVKHFGMDRRDVLASQRSQRGAMLELVALVNRLAERFSRVAFVYRPHPFENLSTYKRLLKRRDNLRLIKSGTVDGWILRSRAVIQWSCSTAIEAAIAGVPALSPAWIPARAQPLAESVSVLCVSEDELTQTLESILEHRFQPSEAIGKRLVRLIKEWFFQIDGRAHERVADGILRSLETGAKRRPRFSWRDSYYGWRLRGESLRSVAGAFLRKVLGLPHNWSFRQFAVIPSSYPWEQSEKFFNADQVRLLVDAIQLCARNGTRETLRKIGVQQAQERGDYRSRYHEGRSVTLFPK
jgi:surface carbohydrate biosynthesis protein